MPLRVAASIPMLTDQLMLAQPNTDWCRWLAGFALYDPFITQIRRISTAPPSASTGQPDAMACA